MAVDMERPLVAQIWSLSQKDYIEWVHEPHQYDQGRRPQMFESPYLEALTYSKWFVVPLVWIPVAVRLWLPLAEGVHSVVQLCEAYLVLSVGLLTWTLLEYGLHRWIFHMDHWFFDARWLRVVHFTIHGVHHKCPTDKLRLVMPVVPAAAIAWAIHSCAWPLLGPVLGLHVYQAWFGSVVLGYIMYDMCHYAFHHWTLRGRDSYLATMKRYHLRHHFAGLYNRGFGITVKLWDSVFGTELE